MKKFAIAIIMLIAALVLTACGGSDLEGKWSLTGGDMYDELMGLGTVDFEFGKDGDMTMTVGALGMTQSQTGTWTTKGDTLVMTLEGEDTSCTYEQDGDTLTLVNDDGSDMILTRTGE